MRKPFRNLIYILFIVLFVSTACAPKPTPQPTATLEPTPEPIVVTDDLGNEITLQGPAQRIVSLSPNMTESLFAMDAGDRIIARESNSNYPEEAQEIESIGAIWEGIPIEKIVSLEPDLVVAAEIISKDQVQNMRDVGLTVFWQANPADFPGLYENLRQLSQLVGKEERAEELVSSLQERVAAVEEKVADVGQKPMVFYELDATDPSNPYTAGDGTFISYVIDKAGGDNLGDVLEGSYVQISSEEIIAQDPDFILLGDAPYGESAETVAERPGWDQLTAVQEGRVLPFDPFLLSVPGPRLVEGFEEMAKMIHPELFEK